MRTAQQLAERSLDLVTTSGKRVAFRVTFGPVRKVKQSARCRVRFYGWGKSPPDIWGHDTLGAFVLAVTLVHSILADFVSGGGRVFWPGTDQDYDLDDFVFSPGASKIKRSK